MFIRTRLLLLSTRRRLLPPPPPLLNVRPAAANKLLLGVAGVTGVFWFPDEPAGEGCPEPEPAEPAGGPEIDRGIFDADEDDDADDALPLFMVDIAALGEGHAHGM